MTKRIKVKGKELF